MRPARMMSFGAALVLLISACGAPAASPALTAHPRNVAAPAPVGPGLLDLGSGAYAFVPERVTADRPAPLLVLMHGAGGTSDGMLRHFRSEARTHGIVLLSVQSRDNTWDLMMAGRPRIGSAARIPASAAFAVDPPRIDAALRALFARVSVDPERIGLAGFSDGAGYALSVGIANPHLFSSVLAFSPGMADLRTPARPEQRIFVSHGTRDPILAHRHTARQLVPALRSGGLSVTFRSFEGNHAVPDEVVREALAFFLSREAS